MKVEKIFIFTYEPQRNLRKELLQTERYTKQKFFLSYE